MSRLYFLFTKYSQGLLLGAALWCLSACKPGLPSDVISPSELEDILYDYHMAQAMAERGSADSISYRRYIYVNSVFKKYGISSADFDSTMVWYSSHPTYLDAIYKNLSEKIQQELKSYGSSDNASIQYAGLTENGDTANIWQESTFKLIRPNILDNKMQFGILADSSFYKGDAFLWRFNSLFMSRNMAEVYATLSIRYDNDSVFSFTKRVLSNTVNELRLDCDTVNAIKSIYGYVYMKSDESSDEFKLLALSDIILVRFHLYFETKKDTVLTGDSINTDSLNADSLKVASDSLSQTIHSKRMSPDELRESRPVEKSINVVKEKPYRIIRRTNRNNR